MRITHEQSENSNKEIKNIREYQTEITQLNNTISEWKNSIEGFHSRLNQAKEKTSKLENRALNFIQSEKQREKNNEKE